ncbi:hypothetical protein FACS189485_12870 [Spirochaetia bacterium]|nr:hypothetical protein FACS189485_12870 [Spirochaetia bacterium]
MTWQEYQESVARLYEQTEGFGKVRRNVYIPDRITGEPRQIDVLIEMSERGHTLKILVDAKYHAKPLDVTVIEGVLSLSDAVGTNKAVIVTASGLTEPAKKKAEILGCDIRILALEDALDLIVPDKWKMCHNCHNDCIVLDQEGVLSLKNGKALWWLAGQCRECKTGFVYCQDCGLKFYIKKDESYICDCGHEWICTEKGLFVQLANGSQDCQEDDKCYH